MWETKFLEHLPENRCPLWCSIQNSTRPGQFSTCPAQSQNALALVSWRVLVSLTAYINNFLSSSNAFNFYTTKSYPNLTWGSKYRMIFDTPPPSNNQWQSFICLSYWLEKMYYYIKIILMIYWLFMMLLFCTTNTLFNIVINGFISCKSKQDHRFSQKWQLRVCKWNFRVCKIPILMKILMKMNEFG